MQTRLILTQNKVWLEAHYVVKEASKLVDFAPHNDIWARVFVEIQFVLLNVLLESFTLLSQFFDLVPKLEHIKELLAFC